MNHRDRRGGYLRVAALVAIGLLGLGAHAYRWRYEDGPAFTWDVPLYAGALLTAVLIFDLICRLTRLAPKEKTNDQH